MTFTLDRHLSLNSPLHHWDPRYKVLGLMALIFAFALVTDLWLIPPMLAVTALFYYLSGLSLGFWLQRLRYPGLFIAGVVLLLPWVSGETVWVQWGSWVLYREGSIAALLIVGRFLSIVTLGLTLLYTSPFLTTVRALRALGLPRILADMMLLSYRYLEDLETMGQTMGRAMVLRGFGDRRPHQPHPLYGPSHDHTAPTSPRHRGAGRSRPPRRQSLGQRLGSWIQEVQQLAAVTGTLLIRSYEQSERVYQAMVLRGYGSGGADLARSPHQGLRSLAVPPGDLGELGKLEKLEKLGELGNPDPPAQTYDLSRLSLSIALARAQSLAPAPHPLGPWANRWGFLATLAVAVAFVIAEGL